MGWNQVGNIKGPKGDPGTAADVAAVTHAATSKATPVDADELPIADSAASFGLKKLSFANLKAWIASVFMTLGTVQTASAKKIFSKGAVVTEICSVGVSTTNVDPDPAVYGPGLHIQTSTKLGGAFDGHSGVFLHSVMPGGWGSAELHFNLATDFGVFNTTTPAMYLLQGGLIVPGYVASRGGAYIGEQSPLLKIKQVTGTTGAMNTSTPIAHGLGAGSKILAVLPVVQTAGGTWVANGWQTPSIQTSIYNIYWNDTNVYIDVGSGATQVASRPFKATIIYTP